MFIPNIGNNILLILVGRFYPLERMILKHVLL